jgi:hypothetical protein
MTDITSTARVRHTPPTPHRSPHIICLALVSLLSLVALASASTECSGETVVGGDDEYNDGGVSLDIAPDGTAWAVWMGSDPVDEDEEVYFATSTQDGWSEQQRLHEQNYAADRFPKLSFGDDSVGWVVWYKSDSDGNRLAVSHGGESGWSAPEVVHPDATRWDDKDVCAIDSTDVWVATATNVPGEEYSAILAYHWQGTVWEGPWQLGMPGYVNDYPDFGVDQSGRPWLIWIATSPLTALGPVLASTWTGTEWTDYEIVSDDSLNGSYAEIAFDGNVPMALWTGPYNAQPDIKYSRRIDGAWTPSGLVNVPDSVTEWDAHPTCVTNAAGVVAAVWDGGNQLDVFSPAVYMSWWEGGAWTPEKQVSGDAPYKIDRFPSAALDEYGGLWAAWQASEVGYLYTIVRASVCTRTTPVSFGPVTVSASGDSVVVRWHASGDAAIGPFTVWRSTELDGEIPPQVLPSEEAILLNEYPIAGPPFEWSDHEVHRGLVNSYWVRWDAPSGERYVGPASIFVGVSPDDMLPARILFVRPNPTHAGNCFHYAQSDEGRVEVELYTVGGRAVRTVSSPRRGGTPLGGESTLCWDGLDDRGQAVASGVYAWQLRFNGKSVPDQNGVVTVIR